MGLPRPLRRSVRPDLLPAVSPRRLLVDRHRDLPRRADRRRRRRLPRVGDPRTRVWHQRRRHRDQLPLPAERAGRRRGPRRRRRRPRGSRPRLQGRLPPVRRRATRRPGRIHPRAVRRHRPRRSRAARPRTALDRGERDRRAARSLPREPRGRDDRLLLRPQPRDSTARTGAVGGLREPRGDVPAARTPSGRRRHRLLRGGDVAGVPRARRPRATPLAGSAARAGRRRGRVGRRRGPRPAGDPVAVQRRHGRRLHVYLPARARQRARRHRRRRQCRQRGWRQ